MQLYYHVCRSLKISFKHFLTLPKLTYYYYKTIIRNITVVHIKLLHNIILCEKPFLICVGVTELLMAPSKHPGCSGTRNLHDNLSDLRAQVAANQKVNSIHI